jgi:uncharacterized protein (TIGR02466 family)
MPTPDDEGFLDLWPTTLVQRSLPGHEQANPVLAGLIGELEADNNDLTTDYRHGNLLAHQHPAMQWLKQCVNRTAVDYLERQGLDYAVDWTLHGWANVNRLGDYHDLHNHPHSYLSGTYYVALPTQPPEAGRRNDLSPGAISFYDPRPQANMNAIRGDAQISPQYTIYPKPGMILMWPSFLHHLVHPNLTSQERVSISFNLVLKWSEDYLPAQ